MQIRERDEEGMGGGRKKRKEYARKRKRLLVVYGYCDDGQNTDPQSMDYPKIKSLA